MCNHAVECNSQRGSVSKWLSFFLYIDKLISMSIVWPNSRLTAFGARGLRFEPQSEQNEIVNS